MTSVSKIVGAVGRSNLRKKLEVADTAISNALTRQVFPPKWYRIVKSECDLIGKDCPLDLFSFTIESKPNSLVKEKAVAS